MQQKKPGTGVRFLIILTSIVLVICIDACTKTSQQAPVVISSVTPDSGSYSTIVTIIGSGFSENITSNSVKFNNVAAVIQQATATQLTVLMPKAAGTGPVLVQVGSQSATGPVFNFSYTITVSTLAGSGAPGYADGDSTAAQFAFTSGVATDALGNIYVADQGNQMIRKITPTGVVTTLAGSGIGGHVDGNGTAAQFNEPTGVATDGQGNVYVADYYNHSIRKITPVGVVSTLAGNGTPGHTDGSGTTAQFDRPSGVATDVQGNIYVADQYNQMIRKITPSGVVSTLAGSGAYGFADGSGTAAQFDDPTGVATDAQGNIYVADQGNQRIRKITPSGVASTLAGNGTKGYANGNGTAAQFANPSGVATDKQGNIYVADYFNHLIRKITPFGVVSTLAGSGIGGYADGSGTAAKFYEPTGVATDEQGNIYVVDGYNYVIRKITVE